MKYSINGLEDVSIKVKDLYMPIDFVIIEIEEDTCTTVILGHIGCHIDVKNGELSFTVEGDRVEFNFLKLLNFLVFFTNAIELMWLINLVKEEDSKYVSSDPLEHFLLNDGTSKDMNPEVAMCS